MALTTKCYGKAGSHLQAGDVDWVADTIKLALVTSAYVPNQGTDEFFAAVTNELAASGGYVAGGYALSGKALSYDSATREERFEADNLSEAALTPSSDFRYGIVYAVVSGILLAYVNFGSDQSNGPGLPFVLQWDPAGVFYIQAS